MHIELGSPTIQANGPGRFTNAKSQAIEARPTCHPGGNVGLCFGAVESDVIGFELPPAFWIAAIHAGIPTR